MRRPSFLVCAVFVLLAVIVLGVLVFPARGVLSLTETPTVQVYLPYVAGPQPTPTQTQTPSSTPTLMFITRDLWLDLGVTLIPASITPGASPSAKRMLLPSPASMWTMPCRWAGSDRIR